MGKDEEGGGNYWIDIEAMESWIAEWDASCLGERGSQDEHARVQRRVGLKIMRPHKMDTTRTQEQRREIRYQLKGGGEAAADHLP